MIKQGDRVKHIGTDYNGAFLNQTGTVSYLLSRQYVRVEFDLAIDNLHGWDCCIEHLIAIELTPEEQAKQEDIVRRKAHAEKYL